MEVPEADKAYRSRRYTIAGYLEMENAATEKHDYYQGEIFAMSGAKYQHNLVAGNIYSALKVLKLSIIYEGTKAGLAAGN